MRRRLGPDFVYRRQLASAKARVKRTRTNKEYVTQLKMIPCMDCKQRFPTCAMDFDHTRGEKLFNIGGHGMNRDTEVLKAEYAV
jgi:hypothetical protein